MRNSKALAIVMTLAAVAIVGTVVNVRPAEAATPNNQACLGHDISGYAQNNPSFPDFLIALAKSIPGIGSVVQLHLAGLVPDSVIPNSCNDQ